MEIGSDIVDIVIRTVIVYLMIVLGLKLLGKKELSQISIADLVFILLISNSVQNAMVGDNSSLFGGLVAAGVLFILNYIFSLLGYRFKLFRKVIEGEPVLLIYHGELQQKNIEKERITEEELMAALREHGVNSIKEVKLAMLEIDGNISVVSQEFVNQTKHKKHFKGLMRS